MTHTFPNGAILTFSLQCVKHTASTEVKPALVASVSAGTDSVWKAIYDIRKHGAMDIDAGDCTYCLQLEYYKPSDFVYESSGKRRALKHLEYPKNLIGEILDTENPKEPTEFMKRNWMRNSQNSTKETRILSCRTSVTERLTARSEKREICPRPGSGKS